MDAMTEKRVNDVESQSMGSDPVEHSDIAPGDTFIFETPDRNFLFGWAFWLDEKFGVEAHGMEPTPLSARTTDIPYFDMAAIWLSSNGVAGSITTGMLGPVVFGLSLKASVMVCIWINMLGALMPAFTSFVGPKYGFRQMVFSRYSFGYWGAKWIALLEILTNLGWSLVTALVGGQLMVSLTNDKLPLVPSIILISVAALIISTFGYRALHFWQRYAWLLNYLVLIIFATICTTHYPSSWPAQGSGLAYAGDTLSFMGVIFGSACGYTPVGSDYYVQYPVDTPWWKPASLTWAGITVSGALWNGLGAAVGAAVMADDTWSSVYNDQGFGSFIGVAMSPMGGFGKFCIVIWWIGNISNLVPNTYSNSLAMQVLGFGLDRLPRFVLTVVTTIIYAVIAIAGREHLSTIIEDFLAVLGYWVCAYFVVVFLEHWLFRRNTGYDRTIWNSPSELPPGIAAVLAFFIGIVGAVMGMAQTWYIGPIGQKFGPYGGDLGLPLTAVFCGISYPPLRYLERKYFKK